MTTLQEQAKALGDPTRHGIFRYVADTAEPVGVSELTEHFGLNHNAIRQHLAKLVAADLLVEEKAAPTGRGRPRLQYTVEPGADSRWGVTGPYERLTLWMSEAIRTGDPPVEVGRRVGQRLDLGAEDADEPYEVLVDQMARHGFEPTTRRRGTAIDITLQTCPFVTTALVDPETVCGLHLGMAEGIADGVEGLVVDELVVKDPRRAGCRLRCHVESDADG